jgi:ribokinase
VIAGFRQAREAGARSLLNPAPMREIPAELLALTDILVLNEHELAECAGLAHASDQPAEVMAKALLARAHPDLTVIATLGAKGCIALTKSEVIRISGEPVEAIDTTGAGDCFVGALAALLAEGLTLNEALRLANRAAAISVTRQGAATSMSMRAEIMR